MSTTTPVRRPTSLTIVVCFVHRLGSARARQGYLNSLAHWRFLNRLRRLAALRDVGRGDGATFQQLLTAMLCSSAAVTLARCSHVS